MRIFIVETKSGGKVVGSFETGEVYENIWGKSRFCNRNGSFKRFQTITNENKSALMLESYSAFEQGYTDQKYAIEILDWQEDDLTLEDFRQPIYYRGLQRYNQKLGNTKKTDNDWKIKEPIRAFCYAVFMNEKPQRNMHIIIGMHRKWIDMIRNGQKQYEFRNVLPKALR